MNVRNLNNTRTANTGLAKVAVQYSAETIVVKIATFAKPETVGGHCKKDTNRMKFVDKIRQKNLAFLNKIIKIDYE